MSRLPAGPRAPAIFQMIAWVLRPAWFMDTLARRHGPNFTARLWGFGPGRRRVVFVGEPGPAETLLDGDPEQFRIGDSRKSIEGALGSASILLLDGADHERHRRLMSAPLAGAAIPGHEPAVREATLAELRGWPVGKRVKLAPGLRAIALEGVVGALFAGASSESRYRLASGTGALLAAATRPFPFGRARRLKRARAQLAEAVREGLVTADRDSAASVLANGLPEEELPDAIFTLLVQYEPVAAALSWCFELLLRHPAALARLEAECRQPGSSGEYLDAVVAEALRLRPPLAALSRVSDHPVQLDDGELPAGAVTAPSSYLAARDRGRYPGPEEFRPERFLEDGAPPSLAFGVGGRDCLGRGLALATIRTALSTLMAHGRFQPASPRSEPGGRRGIVLVPARGARAVLIERR